jgi:hypothetical protein
LSFNLLIPKLLYCMHCSMYTGKLNHVPPLSCKRGHQFSRGTS